MLWAPAAATLAIALEKPAESNLVISLSEENHIGGGSMLETGNRGPSHSFLAVMPISSSCFASPCFVDHLYLDATVVMSSRGRANHGSTQWSGAMEQ